MTKQEKISYIESILIEINKYIYEDEDYSRTNYHPYADIPAYKVETEVLEEAIDMLEMNNMSFKIAKSQHHAPNWTFINVYFE